MFLPTRPLPPSTQFSPTDAFADPDGTESSVPPGPHSRFSSTLSPSLMSDLHRFADAPDRLELLPAMAAIVRHGRPLALDLEAGHGAFRVSVFPREKLFHSTVDLLALPLPRLARLRLLALEPETRLMPYGEDGKPVGALHFAALSPLLWLLAEHGAWAELLPEIDGPVGYRMAPGFTFGGLPVDPSAMPLLQRLRAGTCTLDDLGGWTVRGRTRVCRLLNALYIQAGLMVSRLSAATRQH